MKSRKTDRSTDSNQAGNDPRAPKVLKTIMEKDCPAIAEKYPALFLKISQLVMQEEKIDSALDKYLKELESYYSFPKKLLRVAILGVHSVRMKKNFKTTNEVDQYFDDHKAYFGKILMNKITVGQGQGCELVKFSK